MAATNVLLTGSRVILLNVASTTYSLATNAFNIGGQLLNEGLVATGNQLYPHLVTFMENIIDGDRTRQLTLSNAPLAAVSLPQEINSTPLPSNVTAVEPNGGITIQISIENPAPEAIQSVEAV